MPTYTKKHLPLADQVAQLKQRGLIITDAAQATQCLRSVGYYRLSAYWYPFREIVGNRRTDNFLPASYFEDAYTIYTFDKRFKLLLLDVIESVEIAVRAEIALYLGKFDTYAHTNPAFFRPSFIQSNSNGEVKHQVWLDKLNLAANRSKDEYVSHYERTYGNRSPLPIWIAIELWDFGMLSHFYSGLDNTYCVNLAKQFDIPNWRLMASWLRSLNYVRNVVAHHGRLWNLNLSDNPSLPQPGQLSPFDDIIHLPNVATRIYSICCILCHFSKVINPRSTWPQEFVQLMQGFPVMPYAKIQDMGFPADWQTHGFWK